MANLALIKGERDVAPKYLDLGKAIADPFLDVYGKSVALREQQKEVVKRENEIRANEYASIDTVDLAQIGEDLLEGTTIEANNIKNKAFELIKNKANIDPVEYSIQLANLKKDVADLNANIKIKKILGTDYADADQIGQAPWGDNINKQALVAAIDRNVKKEWIKKDGKYFLSTDGGKTLIDLSNITPPETIDYGIGVSIEENAQKMLQNKVALGQRLTDQNIVDTTDLQIRSMNPSQIKSAALHFNVAGNTEESQKNYYTAKTLDQVTTDVRNAMVDRLKGIQQGLNAKLDAINTPKLSTSAEKARKEEIERLKRINDIKNKFARETAGLFNLERNKEGVVTGGQLDNILINTKSSEFKKLINRMGFSLGDALGEGDDYRGTEIIKQGTNKKYEILDNNSLSNILSRFIQAEGGTFTESDVMGKQGVQIAENIAVIAGGKVPMPQTEEERTKIAREKIAQYSANTQEPATTPMSSSEVSVEEKRNLPYRLRQKLIRERKPFTQENIDQAKKELNL